MIMINVGINDSAIFSQSSVQKCWHHYYEVHKGIKLIVADDDRIIWIGSKSFEKWSLL